MDAHLQSADIRWVNRDYKRVCPSPFVIWFRERSGSSFLCSLLNSHPDIFCRFEDFDLLPIEKRDPGLPEVEPLQYHKNQFYRRVKGFDGIVSDASEQLAIDHLRTIMSKPQTACGFKLKFEIQVAGYPEIVNDLHWMSRSLRVLYLTRKNVLKQAVSRQSMGRMRQQGHLANTRKIESRPPLVLDVVRAVRQARFLLAQERRFAKSVSRFHRVLPVCYEDLQSKPLLIMANVLRFLGVDAECELSSMVQKATPDRLSNAIENYKELADAVAGTELGAMLD